MIDRQNIHKLFTRIDEILTKKDTAREFIIFGSGALIIQGICRQDRATMDIDLVAPEMDVTLQLISAEIGEEYGMDMKWLNSSGHIFSGNFPPQWKKRTKTFFQGKALTVKTLGRQDLIATKLYACCMRNLKTDKDDLVSLKPSEKEIVFAKKWILSLKNSPEEEFINDFLKKIHPEGKKCLEP